MTKRRDVPATWRAPTRRSFLAMLGAVAGAAAIGSHATLVDRELAEALDDALRPRQPYSGPTRWIGHC